MKIRGESSELMLGNKLESSNSKIEYIIIILLFLLSLINLPLLIISLVLSLYLLKQKELGVIKLILIITIRYLISLGIDHSDGQEYIQIFKYILIYIFGFYFVIKSGKIWVSNSSVSKFVTLTFLIGSLYILISCIFSDYPVISFLKTINYFIPLSIIIILVSLIENYIKLLKWISFMISFLIIFSLLFINHSIGYLLNLISFQGVINHPNLFAIIMVMGIIVLIVTLSKTKKNIAINLFVILIGIYELYLSNSRTALLSLVITLVMYLIIVKINVQYKFLIMMILATILFFVFLIPSVQVKVYEFIQKGQSSDNILLSRYSQIENVEVALRNNPVFGSGFGVPLNNSSLNLSNFTFEAGNIIFGLLIFVGIIGLILYLVYLALILNLTPRPFRITSLLLFVTIAVNMGEMIMFSTTNIGLFCYILWGLYLKEGMCIERAKEV